MGPEEGRPGATTRRWALVTMGVALVYFGAAKLGLSLASVNASASPVWPPTGIAIAATLLLGAPALVGVFLGALFANLTTAGTVLTSTAIAAGNTLEAFVVVLLVNRLAGGRAVFDKATDVFRFALIVVLATPVSATVGLATLLAAGLATPAAAQEIWLTWWLGDATGALVVAPAIVLWGNRLRPGWRTSQALELGLVLALTLAIGVTVFGPLGVPGLAPGLPFSYLALPVLVWSAFRLGRRDTATVLVAMAAVADIGTLTGHGPFARGDANESLLLLQTFVSVVSLVALPLAATVDERRRAADELEERVELRTRELAASEGRQRRLLQAAPDAIVIVDLQGRIVLVNDEARAIFGHRDDEAVGRPLDLLLPEAKRLLDRAALADPAGEPTTLLLQGRRKDGEEVPIEATMRPLETPEGTQVMCALRDVTAKRRAERVEREQFVTKRLVRRILRHEALGARPELRRRLGRDMADEAGATTVADHLQAFAAMGLGHVELAKQEADRSTFTGTGLLEVTRGAGVTTCHLALGFLEVAVARVTGATTLGTEVTCQSQGHARCTFVVRAK